jgi:hypothetical protein
MMVKLRHDPALRAAVVCFGLLAPLGACDMIGGDSEGTHRAVVSLDEKKARIAFFARNAAPNDAPEAALECIAADDIGSAYPMKVWVRLGVLPATEAMRTPEGDWRLGERFVPDKLSFVIGGRAFETQERTMQRLPDGQWVFSGELPVYETLYEAIARASFVQIAVDDERRTLSVAAWRKELIETAARCERFTLAWQFTK